MYSQARLKLTLLYSGIFFILFWSFSLGLFYLMRNYLQGSYITQVRERHLMSHLDDDFGPSNVVIATTAGNIALHQLRVVLFYLNGFFLILIPVVTWTLTGQTLMPLKAAHDKERQFVSDASHELKTPLSIMLGETEVTLAKPRTKTEYQQVIMSLKEEVDRLIKLVENLLLLARSDQQELGTTFQPVDLVDVSVGVIAHYKRLLQEKRLKLEFVPPDQAIYVQANETLIKQLLANLIDNAIKYTPEHGAIGVRIKATAKKASIQVKDTGIGIDSAEANHVFDRFYRADSSRSVTRGYGLGLSICKTIVELHHGTIDLASSLKKGSLFTVVLPRQ